MRDENIRSHTRRVEIGTYSELNQIRARTSPFITSIYPQEVQRVFRKPRACNQAKQTLQLCDIFIAFELELTTQTFKHTITLFSYR